MKETYVAIIREFAVYAHTVYMYRETIWLRSYGHNVLIF
jgi:hypothetical protein